MAWCSSVRDMSDFKTGSLETFCWLSHRNFDETESLSTKRGHHENGRIFWASSGIWHFRPSCPTGGDAGSEDDHLRRRTKGPWTHRPARIPKGSRSAQI